MAASDFVAAFEQALGRRFRVATAVFIAAGGISVVAFVFVYVASSGSLPPWFLAFVVIEPLLVGVSLVGVRKNLEKVRSLVRALRHRLSSALVKSVPTLVFDNGLVFTLGSPAPRFYLFGSPSGTKSIPTSQEVGTFLRSLLRMRAVLRVGPKRGPEPLRARIDSIRQAMQSRFSWLFVYLPRPSAPPDPRRPAWVAMLSLGTSKAFLDADRILQQVDQLASLLEDAVAMAQAEQSNAGRLS